MDWYSVSSEASISADAVRSDISSDVSQVPATSSSDFFETLDWTQAQQANAAQPPPPPPHAPPKLPPRDHHPTADPFSLLSTDKTQSPHVTSPSSHGFSSHPPVRSGIDTAEAYERQAGIRVAHVEDPDADQYRFDCEKETPILSAYTPPCASSSEFDLLDLNSSSDSSKKEAAPAPPATTSDLLADLLKGGLTVSPPSDKPTTHTDDLLGEWSGTSNLLSAGPQSAMHRNVSAPVFQPHSATFDPFAEFLSQSASNPTSGPSKFFLSYSSTCNSGSTTPKPSRPNYSRAAFENLNSNIGAKPKVSSDTFGDLLSSQGFTASSKNVNRTLGDMKRAEEIREMDPVSVKIRDWVGGKERNIRALLGSLNDVLWEGADKWQQPRMGDLLSAAQVKRSYYKACLVVHPDKQVGKEHEKLARAIFTELNDAWNAFEQAGSQSL
ncbi:DnaJ domain protein [Oesophagostomum dentatum]|uniref:DnaJ domain protein n=1 Tax=Oesophagostomum dentatum TaxID=61180 RepID=A0A0B1TUX6_OESDE|nr:DnaJ domain protein [Oesophagostomum dentatum]